MAKDSDNITAFVLKKKQKNMEFSLTLSTKFQLICKIACGGDEYFLPSYRIYSIFSGAGKSCLVHGLRQLTHDIKSDIRILNFRNDVTYSLPH